MKVLFYIVEIGKALSIFAVSFALCACRSEPATSAPTIVFDQVPTQNSSAPDQTHTIAGRVMEARSGQRIVLYARNNGRWGVQLQSAQPFTKIETDGRWAGSTQLGSDYAALLVEPGYRPPELTESLSAVGAGVAALEAERVGRVRCVSFCRACGQLSCSIRAGNPAGALGGKRRVFSIDAGGRDRGVDLRGRHRARALLLRDGSFS